MRFNLAFLRIPWKAAGEAVGGEGGVSGDVAKGVITEMIERIFWPAVQPSATQI